MRTFQVSLIFVLPFLWLITHPALADQNVSCVQEQLLEEGINAGTVDGVMGGKTRSAILVLQKKIPELQNLPQITVANASVYCRSIGLARNSKSGWSNNEGFVRLTVGSETSAAHKERIVKIAAEVEEFYREELNVILPQRLDLIVSSSVDQVAALAEASLRRQGSHSSISKWFKDWCRGYSYCGKSYGGVVAISFSAKKEFPEVNIREVIAHEIAHEIQVQYVGNFRSRGAERRIQQRGPKWLTEALAGALGLKFKSPHDSAIKYQLNNLNSRWQYIPERLKEFREQESSQQKDFQDYSTFAGLLLASNASHLSIINFWEKTPELGWKAAFHVAFEMSVDEFYDSFGNL